MSPASSYDPWAAVPKRPEKCPMCERPLSPGEAACSGCGFRPGTVGSSLGRVGQQDTYAAASAAAGVAGFMGAPILGPILAILCGRKAKERLAQDPSREGADLARAGLALGWIGLTITLVVGMIVLFAFCSIASKMGDDSGPGFFEPGSVRFEEPVSPTP